MFRISVLARKYSTKPLTSYFKLFPQNFPHGGPPADSFLINPKLLRREYRNLQSENHPDVVNGSALLSNTESNGSESTDTSFSELINKAYTSLKNPYSRVIHFIKLYHPLHIDLSQDDNSKELIKKFQTKSTQSTLAYKEMLMNVLEVHERLELATSEEELEELEIENEERIKETEAVIAELLQGEVKDWDDIMMTAIQLKYWITIQNGIRDWEPGKPMNLTH
ncbi:J-type co-chaperone JAC1 mitochondrial [Spathaspora sp. JA1]|nr:J-type co-chaperone JAC1 mitochondrial [Spathaspora sp. JA1]